jgi:hypothetical protein
MSVIYPGVAFLTNVGRETTDDFNIWPTNPACCSEERVPSIGYILDNQCCGSGMFIPDLNFFHPGSRVKKILGSRIRIKIFKYFNQKIVLSSRKYDPGCFSRIRIPDRDLDFLPILDPGSRGQKGTGSRIRVRNTVDNSALQREVKICEINDMATADLWRKGNVVVF